jgi:hypothetical protein
MFVRVQSVQYLTLCSFRPLRSSLMLSMYSMQLISKLYFIQAKNADVILTFRSYQRLCALESNEHSLLLVRHFGFHVEIYGHLEVLNDLQRTRLSCGRMIRLLVRPLPPPGRTVCTLCGGGGGGGPKIKT